MDVALSEIVETENVVEAEVAFCLKDSSLEAMETEKLTVWVAALVEVWTQPP